MGEIVCLHIGNCGNGIGREFWEVICGEHGISETGAYVAKRNSLMENLNVYFTELRGFHYSPRAVMIDLDQNSMEELRSAPFGQIFRDKNFIYGTEGASNNWAKGHLSEGAQLCDKSLDIIRREVEACECFHGFQIAHSIGGGTGGGLGSLIVSKLMDEYPTRIINTYTVIPSETAISCVVEPYNAILSLNHLIESSHGVHCFDNEALCNVATDAMNIEQSSFKDLNYLITTVMSGITSCLRFLGPSSTTLRKVAVNMTPFPRLHFYVLGTAPLFRPNSISMRQLTTLEIINELFDYKNLFMVGDLKKGKYISVKCIFRGEVSQKDLDKQMYNIQSKNSTGFVEWIPDNIKTSICSVPPVGMKKNATLIGNTTYIQHVFSRIKEQYLNMFRKKVFLHWYTAEGLDELEFQAAEANLTDLINEYQESEIAKVTVPDPPQREPK